VHLGIAARLTAPALGSVVLGRPIDLHPDHVWWQDAVGGPVPLSVPVSRADALIADDWDRQLVDAVLTPVTAAIAALVSISDRVLRGNLASAVNAAAVAISRQRTDLADDAWQAARRLFAMSALRGERQPPGPGFRRSSCCLFYRLAPGRPTATCGDCILDRS
jgi:ferric iron reductase protein FhuF